MTTAELAEKVWWSAAKRFPWRSWRFSGTTGYRVLVIKDETHALVERVVKHKGWRKVALQPREVRQAVKRLRGIRRLSARSKTAVGTLSESLEHSRRTRVCLVQDGTDRQYRDRIVVHEIFHQFQYHKRLHNRPVPKALLAHPATSKALPYLRNQYDVDDAVLIVSEMAAYIFSGDHAAVGLGRREAQEWLSAYFRKYAVNRAQTPSLRSPASK